ncbi:MAG: hypothetical protein Q8M08_05505 [Bacteroidales bacterium]|nr:hypothetical protein [Bacteroidales bacterium]
MKKTFKLIINPFAELDLRLGYEFYELQKPGLGNDFINEVDVVLRRIEKSPLQFSQEKSNIRKALVNRFPFGIYFYLTEDIINVFAVFHFSRSPKKLSKRMRKR